MTKHVPVIDLAPFISGQDRDRVVREVDAACRGLGFLVIKGHGVEQSIIDGALRGAQQFFDMSAEEKLGVHVGQSHGYQKFANMSLSQSYKNQDFPPDLREALTMRRSDFGDRSAVFDGHDSLATIKGDFSSYYAELNRVANVLLEIFECALGTAPRYLRDRSDEHDSNLSLYHYPAMTEPPLPGQVRGGEHTDFGSITILLGYPSVHGLQIRNGDDWEDAPLEPGTFVVNIGDLMERWTNDMWRSTVHRVANPIDGDWDQERYSIVFFHQPDYDAVIESLDTESPAKYDPITSGEHFRRKSSAMHAGITT